MRQREQRSKRLYDKIYFNPNIKPLNIFDEQYECNIKVHVDKERKRQSAFDADPRAWKSIAYRD